MDRFECRLTSAVVADEAAVRSVIRSLCDDATHCSEVRFHEAEYALLGAGADEPEQDSIMLRRMEATACDNAGMRTESEPVLQCEMCYRAAADSLQHQRNPLHKKHNCRLPVEARRSLGTSTGSNAEAFITALGFALKQGCAQRACQGSRWISRGGLTVQLLTDAEPTTALTTTARGGGGGGDDGGSWHVEIFNTCAPSEIERGLRQVEQFALLLEPLARFGGANDDNNTRT